VDPAEVLSALGGVATHAQLLVHVSRGDLDRAVTAGTVLHLARDRYALPEVDSARARAHALSAVLCLTSAALFHGWAVKSLPEHPHIAVSRNRRLTPEQHRGTVVHRRDLQPDDVVDGIATSKETTLLHCLRQLPEDEALAIADSAARSGEVSTLRRVARMAQGRGAARIRRLAALARAEADNPFESVTRAIALSVPGLNVEPQRLITSVEPWARPDLVDVELRIVIEADSFQWHGDRAALRRDARRYDLLVVDDWIVLRFSWEDVMFDSDWVRSIMVSAVELAHRRTKAA
jgi:very-short-patch-repair endonuclease